jgi:hypothetical protein
VSFYLAGLADFGATNFYESRNFGFRPYLAVVDVYEFRMQNLDRMA